MSCAPNPAMALRMWRRNALVFSKLWRGALLPPFLDPLVFLLGLGLGLGSYVAHVGGVSYRDFVAPGLCASAVLWQASFEATFSVFFRMDMLHVHENVLTTPVEPEDLVLGELLWGATKATIYATAFLAMIAVLGFVHSAWALLLPPFLFLGGLVFSALGMAYTVLNRKLDYYTYYFTFVVNPLFLFGGIFFPYDSLPGWAQRLAWLLPTVHLVDIARSLTQDPALGLVVGNALWLGVAATLLALIPLRQLRRRLVA